MVIAVKEVIMLDEGTRCMSGGKRMGCSSWKGSKS